MDFVPLLEVLLDEVAEPFREAFLGIFSIRLESEEIELIRERMKMSESSLTEGGFGGRCTMLPVRRGWWGSSPKSRSVGLVGYKEQ